MRESLSEVAADEARVASDEYAYYLPFKRAERKKPPGSTVVSVGRRFDDIRIQFGLGVLALEQPFGPVAVFGVADVDAPTVHSDCIDCTTTLD